MKGFTAAQVEVLRSLRRLWPPEKFVVIGAAALGCFMEMEWRMTYDLDLCVALGLDAYPKALDSLPGWRRDPLVEHRWAAPGPVRVDVLPADNRLLRRGEIIWPRSARRMSLLGLRLALESAVPVKPISGMTVRVAPLPAVFLLKAVAYQEQPHERERDLEDLAHVLEAFEPDDPEVRFSDEVIAAGLEYEEVGPFLLGRQLGSLTTVEERRAIESFLSAVEGEDDPQATQARMLALGPRGWRRDPRELLRRVAAFRRGFEAAAKGSPRS